MIQIKILTSRSPQFYAVKRSVLAACTVLQRKQPDLEFSILQVKGWAEIEKYTCVLILPSLMINEKLVCVGRFPTKDEVVNWLWQAIDESGSPHKDPHSGS